MNVEPLKVCAVRVLRFCAGHRVYQHESKCRHLHGHNYDMRVYAEGLTRPQDALGRVVDFAVLKDVLGNWVDVYWDHGFLLFDADTEGRAVVSSLPGQKLYLMPTNPTAENLAAYMLHDISPGLLAPHGVRLVRVDVWETPNCMATVTL